MNLMSERSTRYFLLPYDHPAQRVARARGTRVAVARTGDNEFTAKIKGHGKAVIDLADLLEDYDGSQDWEDVQQEAFDERLVTAVRRVVGVASD